MARVAGQPSSTEERRLALNPNRRPTEDEVAQDRAKRRQIFNQRYGWIVQLMGGNRDG